MRKRVAQIATVVVMTFSPAAVAQGPFSELEGLWTGDGTVTLSSGAQEPVRCRVQYSVVDSGEKLQQALRCASPSYRIEVNAEYTHSAGAVSGLWTETTRKVSGNVAGRASGDRIEAQITGPFSAHLVLATTGTRQAVTVQPKSADVREVSVELRKGPS
jgi:hypothetical protein